MDIDQLVTLMQTHAWIPLASVVIGLAVRLVKSDKAVAWFPIAIPPQVRSWLALGLGLIAGVLDKVVAGAPWPTAMLGGLVAAISAISGHELVVESLRGGRDIGVPKGAGGGGGDAPKVPIKLASLKPDAPVGPYSHMVRHHLVRLACVCMAGVVFVGCGGVMSAQAVQSAIDTASQYLNDIQDALALISAIRSAIDGATHGGLMASAPAQKLDQLLSDASLALDKVERAKDAAKGVVDSPEVAAATDAFGQSWDAMAAALKDAGIVVQAPPGHLMVFAGKGTTLDVRPMLLVHAAAKRGN